MPWRTPPRPGDAGAEAAQADIVGVWPSAVWILVGTLHYLGQPQAFAGWKGGIYFVAGTAVVALLVGAVSQGARRGIAGMLAEVFPRPDRFTALVALLLRLMLRAAECLLVSLLARGTLDLLG